MIGRMMRRNVSCRAKGWMCGLTGLGRVSMTDGVDGSARVKVVWGGVFACMRFAFILLRLMTLRFWGLRFSWPVVTSRR